MARISGLIGDLHSKGGILRIVLSVIVVAVVTYVLVSLVVFIIDGFLFTEEPPTPPGR